MKCALDGLVADLDDLIELDRARKIACNLVQRSGALLAMQRDARLGTQAGGELPRYQPNGQHDAKRQKILHVAHREGKSRRHEKEIESADAQYRRERRRTAAQAHADEHHCEQINGHDIGGVEAHRQRHRQRRHGAAPDRRPHIA